MRIGYVQRRRKAAKQRLEATLENLGSRKELFENELRVTRIKQELATLDDRLAGVKRTQRRKTVKGEPVAQSKEKWFIDIYAVQMGYVKQSERRKNKGKSKKKLKRRRSVTFVKSVVLHDGLLAAYREGRMGISPKSHSFRVRRDETYY